jgi:hypothetical protein
VHEREIPPERLVVDAAVGGRKRVLAASIAFSVGPVLYNRQ